MYPKIFLGMVCSMLFLCISLWSQDTPNGLIFDDAAFEDMALIPSEKVRGGTLPWSVSLKPYTPTPGDQGFKASCVGWAMANTLTMERMIRSGITDRPSIDQSQHSPEYIYNQIKNGPDCDALSRLNPGFQLLANQGVCLASEFVDYSTNCSAMPDDQQRRAASKFRTVGQVRIFNLSDPADIKIESVQAVLADNHPVFVAMRVPADMRWRPVHELNWTRATAGHCMVIVGYDEDTETFEIMNSYGESWGDNGFFRISYDDFSHAVCYAFRLLLPGDTFD